jgi:hypothetical protein
MVALCTIFVILLVAALITASPATNVMSQHRTESLRLAAHSQLLYAPGVLSKDLKIIQRQAERTATVEAEAAKIRRAAAQLQAATAAKKFLRTMEEAAALKRRAAKHAKESMLIQQYQTELRSVLPTQAPTPVPSFPPSHPPTHTPSNLPSFSPTRVPTVPPTDDLKLVKLERQLQHERQELKRERHRHMAEHIAANKELIKEVKGLEGRIGVVEHEMTTLGATVKAQKHAIDRDVHIRAEQVQHERLMIKHMVSQAVHAGLGKLQVTSKPKLMSLEQLRKVPPSNSAQNSIAYDLARLRHIEKEEEKARTVDKLHLLVQKEKRLTSDLAILQRVERSLHEHELQQEHARMVRARSLSTKQHLQREVEERKAGTAHTGEVASVTKAALMKQVQKMTKEVDEVLKQWQVEKNKLAAEIKDKASKPTSPPSATVRKASERARSEFDLRSKVAGLVARIRQLERKLTPAPTAIPKATFRKQHLTHTPTVVLTHAPTPVPDAKPSVVPQTPVPTAKPSVVPTQTPVPTGKPSVVPTQTPVPTDKPSALALVMPPTGMPSDVPTLVNASATLEEYRQKQMDALVSRSQAATVAPETASSSALVALTDVPTATEPKVRTSAPSVAPIAFTHTPTAIRSAAYRLQMQPGHLSALSAANKEPLIVRWHRWMRPKAERAADGYQ